MNLKRGPSIESFKEALAQLPIDLELRRRFVLLADDHDEVSGATGIWLVIESESEVEDLVVEFLREVADEYTESVVIGFHLGGSRAR